MNLQAENYNLAIEMLKEESYTESIEHFTKFINDNPFILYGSAYLWRGYSKYKIGDLKGAKDDLEKSSNAIFQSNDENDILRFYTFNGLNYSKLKNYNEAIKNLDEALKINPKSDIVNLELYKVSVLNEDIYRSDLAFSNLKKYLVDFNKIVSIAENLIYSEQELNAGIKICNDLITLSPNSDICYFFKAIANYELGNHDEALINIDKNLELHPINFGAHTLRGLIYQNQNSLANKEFLKAFELGDKNALSYIKNNIS